MTQRLDHARTKLNELWRVIMKLGFYQFTKKRGRNLVRYLFKSFNSVVNDYLIRISLFPRRLETILLFSDVFKYQSISWFSTSNCCINPWMDQDTVTTNYLTMFRNSRLEVFHKKGALRNFAKFTRKHLWQSQKACNFIIKETLAQAFSCEFCEISKNTFFTEHLWWLILHVQIMFLRRLEMKDNYPLVLRWKIITHCTKNEVFHKGFLQ